MSIEAVEYNPSDFAGFSQLQMENHLELYKKYVDNYNENFEEKDQSWSHRQMEDANGAYSIYSEWLKKQSLLLNAIILHELFFDNIKRDETDKESEKEVKEQLIDQYYSSVTEWESMMRAAASSTNGWIIFGKMIGERSGLMAYHIITVEGHTNGIPVNFLPIVVIDTWEHAYMTDFNIDKKEYMDSIFESLNWNVIRKRIYG